MNMKKEKNPFMMPAILSLTLGLAPFVPEPHIYKQYLNIINGTFTEPIDWFDLAMHGFPWIWLLVVTVQFFFFRKKKEVK